MNTYAKLKSGHIVIVSSQVGSVYRVRPLGTTFESAVLSRQFYDVHENDVVVIDTNLSTLK